MHIQHESMRYDFDTVTARKDGTLTVVLEQSFASRAIGKTTFELTAEQVMAAFALPADPDLPRVTVVYDGVYRALIAAGMIGGEFVP